ncbi:MAG: flagellar assembly protein FliW [Synergistaceae bacterium]|nr:flagellar assembly protein FliW [Synergistaceae bacterium]
MSRRFVSRYFGRLSYEPEDVLSFPRGLVGFEQNRSWLLLDDGKGSGVRWLQSLDEPELAFPVTAPDAVKPDYAARISEDDLQSVGALGGQSDNLALLVLLTVPQTSPWEATANLRAPILVNAGTRQALQVIALDEAYSIRQPVNAGVEVPGGGGVVVRSRSSRAAAVPC